MGGWRRPGSPPIDDSSRHCDMESCGRKSQYGYLAPCVGQVGYVTCFDTDSTNSGRTTVSLDSEHHTCIQSFCPTLILCSLITISISACIYSLRSTVCCMQFLTVQKLTYIPYLTQSSIYFVTDLQICMFRSILLIKLRLRRLQRAAITLPPY